MNRIMRDLVDVAFRLVGWSKASVQAKEAGTEAPAMPPLVLQLVQKLAGTGPDARSRMVRVMTTLSWFVRAGCRVVSLDEDTARGFTMAAPPDDGRVEEWPLSSAYGLAIGQGAVIVRHVISAHGMPDEAREHFDVVDGVVRMEAYVGGGIGGLFEESDALDNLIQNTGVALTRRPDGLTIAARHPSRQAARKQGWDPDHLPSVDYVIGSTTRPRREADGDGSLGGGHKMTVRTHVEPHWTHQPHGPRSSLRRVQWIPLHWRGPVDAPISVHATRIVPKKPTKK